MFGSLSQSNPLWQASSRRLKAKSMTSSGAMPTVYKFRSDNTKSGVVMNTKVQSSTLQPLATTTSVSSTENAVGCAQDCGDYPLVTRALLTLQPRFHTGLTEITTTTRFIWNLCSSTHNGYCYYTLDQVQTVSNILKCCYPPHKSHPPGAELDIQ